MFEFRIPHFKRAHYEGGMCTENEQTIMKFTVISTDTPINI